MKNLWFFVVLAVVFTVGICLYPVWWTMLFAGLWLIRLYVFKHKKVWYFSCVAILCAVSSIGIKQHQASVIPENLTHGKIVISAHTVKVNGDFVHVKGYLKNEWVSVYFQLKTLQEKTFWLDNTDDLTIEATFSLQTYPLPRNPYQFNYQHYMNYYENSYWQVDIVNYTILSQSINWSKVIQKIWQINLPDKLSELIGSLFFDETNDISEIFQQAGLLSLVSLSGIHITWLLQGIAYCLLRLGITKERTQLCLKIVAAILWLLLGKGIGTKKTILLFYLQNRGSYLDRLSWITLVFLMINPYFLFHLGFQFSFGLSFFRYILNKQPFKIALISLPLLSYYFFEINFIPLLIGFPLLKLFKFFIFPAVFLVKPFPFLISPIVYCVDKLTVFIHFLSTQHGLTMVTGRLSEEHYIVTIIILLIYFSLPDKFSKVTKPLIIGFLFLLFSPIQYKQITMIDVGQGSSLLIQINEEALLIDTGGKLDFTTKETWKKRTQKSLAKDVLVPTLKAFGIKNLTGVIITHADLDHYQALADLKKYIPIQNIYYGKGAPVSGTHAIVAPERIQFSHLALDILYPLTAGVGENDDSLIIFTRFGGLNWLITGDASEVVEKKLMQRYPNLKADVLVVGHHGSQTSTSQSFIQQISPRYSLISVGKNNRYGHPHAVILERLKKTKVYRTDQMGAIQYTLKHKEKKWQTTLPKNDNR